MFPIGLFEIGSAAVLGALAFVAAFLLGRFSRWTRRRVLIASSVPIPGILAALCVAIFVHAASSSREACGIDACGMAMAAALTGFVTALAALALCSVFALLGLRLARK
jgi:hypothetical protein